jgi:NAD-binding of NADP-dependent 3-hydroxyisobutyrate dehydrogenase
MGGVGWGQLTKLLNNAMTMTNLKNAVDVFGLAKNLGIDIRRLYEVIILSSGSRAVLQSIGSQINSKAAVHIQGLMRKDIEHFADAMRARGLDPSSVRKRGLGGADGVLELAQWIESRTTFSRRKPRSVQVRSTIAGLRCQGSSSLKRDRANAVMATTPVRIVGSGTGANCGEWVAGNGTPVRSLSFTLVGSEAPSQKQKIRTE